MARTALSLEIADLSAYAKSLRTSLGTLGHPPSHVELLNLLSRSAGYRNYQHFRMEAPKGVAAAPAKVPPLPAADGAVIEKTARYFDAGGRLVQWPARVKHQELCLWVLWSRIPPRVVFTEKEIGALLTRWHLFADHALLRRALYDTGKVDRTRDGREYRRIEQPPPPELRALLGAIGATG
jgi:hypothetical protein